MLCCAVAGGLTGCGNESLAGKTLYSVSAWDGSPTDAGEVTTITFDDSDGYHYAPADSRYEETGTWKDEDGDIVLTSSTYGDVRTLRKMDDGGYLDTSLNEEFGERYYTSEDDAQAYTDGFIEDAPQRVAKLLESSDFTETGSNWAYVATPETISFADGKVTFTKGVYKTTNNNGESFGNKTGPDDDEWAASDHTGDYEVTVDKMVRDTSNGSSYRPRYEGTITIDGQALTYRLLLNSNGTFLFTLDDGKLTFTASE